MAAGISTALQNVCCSLLIYVLKNSENLQKTDYDEKKGMHKS